MNNLPPVLHIPNPCSAEWHAMEIGLHSRNCLQCNKAVVDFTDKSREEILAYLINQWPQPVCGRLYPSQLNLHHTDLLATVRIAATNKPNRPDLPFYLLALTGLLMYGCGANDKPLAPDNQHQFATADTTKTIGVDTVTITHIPPQETALLGEVVLFRADTTSAQTAYTLVDEMPEFPGGFDSLQAYLRQELAKVDTKEAVVVIKTIIDTNGMVSSVKAVNSSNANHYLNEVAEQAVYRMPAWKPGRHKGKAVPVLYHLPIRFTKD